MEYLNRICPYSEFINSTEEEMNDDKCDNIFYGKVTTSEYYNFIFLNKVYSYFKQQQQRAQYVYIIDNELSDSKKKLLFRVMGTATDPIKSN